jgi:hypothetical protein
MLDKLVSQKMVGIQRRGSEQAQNIPTTKADRSPPSDWPNL